MQKRKGIPVKYLEIGTWYGSSSISALSHYINVLEDTFIFLVDDWNFMHTRDGTFRAIKELNLTVNFRHEIFISPEDLYNMPNHKGAKTWWNGCGIFVLTKPKNL